MKIISKFRDFYDYLQGVYGIDEKLVLDRTDFFTTNYRIYHMMVNRIHIGEVVVDIFFKDGNLYIGDEVEQFSVKKKLKYHWIKNDKYNIDKENFFYIKYDNWSYKKCLKHPVNIGELSPTWKAGSPILYEHFDGKICKNPILSQYNVQKVLSAHEVWLELSSWLGKRITKNEPDVPIGDDKTRIVSAGFDLKTSFRKIK